MWRKRVAMQDGCGLLLKKLRCGSLCRDPRCVAKAVAPVGDLESRGFR